MGKTTAPVRLTPEAREALRNLTYRLTGSALRQVDMSETVITACRVAEENYDSTVRALAQLGADQRGDSDDQH